MKTMWDALFVLFELKEARLIEISKKIGISSSSAHRKLAELANADLVVHEHKIYKPNKKNPRTWNAFNIMKFCRSKGINYNLFFSEEFSMIVQTGLSKGEVALADFKDSSYLTTRKYLTYLNRINLIFITSKRPLKVKFIHDPVLYEVLDFFEIEKPKAKKLSSRVTGKEYAKIENLLKKADKIKQNLDLGELEEELRIEFTSASTQLEGNTFTLEESRELILHDVVPEDKKLKEANEVKNYYNALNYFLLHLEEPLSLDLILNLHRLIIYNLGVKEGIRNSRVSIKGNPFYKISHFSKILPELEELCKKVNEFNSEKRSTKKTIEFAAFVHNEFQHIHPFEDGNSRMTRLLWNYVLMKNGFPIINIYANAKEEYLSLTKLSMEREDPKLNAFFVKVIKDNLFKRLRKSLE